MILLKDKHGRQKTVGKSCQQSLEMLLQIGLSKLVNRELVRVVKVFQVL